MFELRELILLCLLYFLHLVEHLEFFFLSGLFDLFDDLVSLLQHLVIFLKDLQLLLDDRLDQVLSDKDMAFLLRHHRGGRRLISFFDKFVKHSVDQKPYLYRLDIVYFLVEDLSKRKCLSRMFGDEMSK